MLELYGAASCPFTPEMRENLEFQRREFVEYDVECDGAAMKRLLELRGGERNVPVLVEDGRVLEVGFRGRACYAGSGT